MRRLRADRCAELDTLARKASRWGADNIEALRSADPDVRPRRPLIAIADAAGGDWPSHARQIAEHAASGAEAKQSDAVLLLADIRTLFAETKNDRLKSADIAGALAGIEGRAGRQRTANKAPLGRAIGAIRHPAADHEDRDGHREGLSSCASCRLMSAFHVRFTPESGHSPIDHYGDYAQH